ncbi:hypothetical protein L873DRAFT_759406 [Choiromyces venosus 120613-1]|uniref:JmjC domain-containing histone demethylation protein 1 n=1 Tax=Choiromyces venosus 120613-1 TaxID=1336337 RepID=A0A3N4JWZ9_9PEZI|nr:hypothetical protein L873DRAFT_759406 [Choiromyces venosus 120613-1]
MLMQSLSRHQRPRVIMVPFLVSESSRLRVVLWVSARWGWCQNGPFPLDLLVLSLFCTFAMYLRADIVGYSGIDMKDVEDVDLGSNLRGAGIPEGDGPDKMDVTVDIRGLLFSVAFAGLFINIGVIESDEMMIDTDPTTSPSVTRDKSDLIPPTVANGDTETQSLEAGAANEGQPMDSNKHDPMLVTSEIPEEPRVIREGSVDYEVDNAAGDEPVFGAGGAVEVGITPEVISPKGPIAGVRAGVSEPAASKPGQDKPNGAEYQQLRVLSPTGESPREPANPSDEKCETCRGPYQDGHGFRFDQIAWIGCDGCGTWHHSRCVGLDNEMVNKIDKFYCSRCTEVHGPSTMKRKSNRATTAIDYNALHNGSSAPIKNPVDGKLHPYIEIIRNRTFTFADDKLPRMRPEQVTVEFLEDLPNGWNQPFIVPAESNPAPWVTPLKATTLDSGDKTTSQIPSEENSGQPATPPPPPLATSDGNVVGAPATPSPPSKAENSLPEMTLDNGDFDPAEVDRLKQTLREGEYDVRQRRPGADNLDMIIPPGLTVRKVSELIGESARVEMINVLSQATEKDDKWQMEQLVNYFESDLRDVIYNCISCEVSNTELGTMISRPQVVRDLDLADKVWRPDPAPSIGSEAKPRVGKYVLMSVADSFTDFHIDFAGSSVFYHIYEGEKVFLVIPPTEHNLDIYEKWSMDPSMNTTFFPTLISDPCTIVTLNKGDTMFIPSGWIHAVYTPRDSLVVGGNFLTRNHYAMQMKIQRIEVITDTKLSQRYPKYTTLMWHLAYNYMTKDPISDEVDEALGRGRVLKRTKQRPPKTARIYTQQELEGLPALCNFLLRTALVSCGTITTSLVPRRPNLTAKQIEAVKKAIPAPINQEPVEWIKRFGRWCIWKRACQRLIPDGERAPEWALESWWPKDGPKKGPSRAALRRAQRAREEEARKAEPPRRPGLRVRAIRAESTISSGSDIWQEEGGPSRPRPKKRTIDHEAPPAAKRRGRPPNKPQPPPTFDDGDNLLIGKRKPTIVEGEDGEAFTLSDGCTYVRKLSNLGPPRAGCQNCRLKKTGCKHKSEIAQLLTRLEASDRAAKAARGEREGRRVEPVLAPALMEDIEDKEMAEVQVVVPVPAKEKKTPTPRAKTDSPTLKRVLPEDADDSIEDAEVTPRPLPKKKKRVVVSVERAESAGPSVQNMAGGRPPGFQGRKPSCDRCKELKARCPHDTWHLAIERQATRIQKADKPKSHKKGGGRLSLGKATKSSWDGARQTSAPRRHSSGGNTSTVAHEKTPEPGETDSILEEIIVVSSKPPSSRLPVPEVRIIKTPTKHTTPPVEKNSFELDMSILEEPMSYKSRVSHTPEDPSIMAPPLDDLEEASKPTNPSSPSPPPTTVTPTTVPSATVISTSTTTTSSFTAPETLTPPTDHSPFTNGTTTAATTASTSTATITTTSKKAEYPRLTHRAPKPKVTYTKTTKTVKRKEDEDRISPPVTTSKLAKSISPGLTAGGKSGGGGSGSRKSVSPALAEEDLRVEEIKRMAAKEEFGLRVRRSS